MAYRHNNAFHKHKKRARLWTKAAVAFSVLVVVLAVIVGVDWVRNQASNSNTVVSRATTSVVQSANISVYRSEFFKFQAAEEWVFVSNQSTEDKFVYIKYTGELVTQRLVVHVNKPISDREGNIKLTHVMPVEINSLGSIVPFNDGNLPHCDESMPDDGNRDPRRIEHQEVEFVCAPGSAEYNILVGKYKGDERLPVTLQDGREIDLTIIYSDFTAYPNKGDLPSILSSFQVL